MLTVLIIDSKPILIEGIERVLKERYKVVSVTGVQHFADFYKLDARNNLNLILIGINEYMGIKMTSIINEIKRKYPEIPLVAYQQQNGHNLEDDVLLLKLGVNGYLSSSSTSSELLNCVENVLSGKRYIDSQQLPALLELLLGPIRPRTANPFLEARLTSRQNEVAKLLITGTRVSFIADTLGLKISTISSIKKTILSKFQVENVLELKDAMAL